MNHRLPDADARLAALEERIRQDLDVSSHQRDWVPRPDGDVLDVLVVGGGQAGLAVAFALGRERIDHVRVVDDGPEEQAGAWNRYARMHTLRSPKHMVGIEMDVPSLHLQRWFEAVYGDQAWEQTTLVGRQDWNSYLIWYRKVTGVQVRHLTRVVAVHRPERPDGPFAIDTVPATDPTACVQQLRARRVVFALGLDGGGGPSVPAILRDLPKERWAHTEDAIDFDSLRGRRVAVLGGGASGFDNAATALEHGAASAEVFMRRSEVPTENPLRWMEFPGMQEHFADLEDEQRWEFTEFNGGLPQPPTQHAIWRCFDQPGFALHMESGWNAVEVTDGPSGEELLVHTTQGDIRADFVIAATGYAVDLGLRPELAEFVDDISRWEEHLPESAGQAYGRAPYLGPAFEFTARDVDRAPWVSRLYHFSTGARSSMGVTGNQLSGIHGGVKRIAWGITGSIFRENWPTLMAEFRNYHHVEITSVGPRDTDGPDYPRFASFRRPPRKSIAP